MPRENAVYSEAQNYQELVRMGDEQEDISPGRCLVYVCSNFRNEPNSLRYLQIEEPKTSINEV